MKAHKKTKQNLIVTETQAQTKTNTPRTVLSSQNTDHRKLLQYKDYLFSLRKIDLGTLIQQNKIKKTPYTQPKPLQPPKTLKQPYLIKNQLSPQIPNKSTPQQSSNQHQIIKPLNLKQIYLKIDKPLNTTKPQQTLNEQKTNQEPNKPTRNSFKLLLKQDTQQNDLYCNEDMQEIMNKPIVSTPKLIHVNHFCNHQTQRDYSTHRSSKNRDLSMPSIEQRNLSEQSEENLDKNAKSTARSISEGIKHRKNNSSTYSTPLNAEKQTIRKHHQKKNSQLIGMTFLTKALTKEEMNKTFDNSHLFSTNDFSSNQKGNNNDNVNKKYNVQITPFDYQPDFSHVKQKRNLSNLSNPINDAQIFHTSQQKQPHKLSLNVSQIVKRINSRQSKSSMSDRSYRKHHQSRNQNNICHTSRQSHEKIYSDMMKQKFAQFLSHQSTVPLKQIHLTQQISKKKSFKTQVKEFREKHYLMMRLA